MTNVILDFNDLATGAIVGDQFSDKGVTVSSGSASNPPMIFDSANPTGGDWDLASDTAGKVLILSEDGDSNDPDDNAGGGTLRFDFDSAAHVHSIRLFDIERGGTIKLYDEAGDLIEEIDLPCTPDGGEYLADIGVEGVYAMEVCLPDSGAIDDLSYSIDLPAELDGIVEGTDGDDLIDLAYTGDPEGDRIDNGDAILPGEGPDDDIVWAGAGDDTVMGGEGDDEIWGDRAQVDPGKVTITLGEPLDVTYPNKLFAYTIDPETGEITNLVMLSDNALNDGGKVYEYDAAPGAIIGVGIYSPDGVFLSSGYGENVDLNSDGKVHTRLVSDNPDGSVTLGFEDLECLGDEDFNDVIVTVDLGTSGAIFDNAHVDYSSDAPGYDDSGVGNDTLYGEAGDDVIYGQGGNDTIYGGDGSDTAYGGDGDDVIDTSSDTGYPLPDRGFPGYGPIPAVPADSDPTDDMDIVFGGAGNDTITTGDDADYIDGGDGDDVIDGGIDDDTIFGGAGADLIVGGEGSDAIGGGAGDDTIYGGLDPAYPDALNIRDDGTDPYGADPVQDNGRDLIFGGAGNDTIYGQDDNDTIYGGDGTDVIDGGIDDDTIFGGADSDLILGGQGDDDLDGEEGDDIVLGGTGDDIVKGGAGTDILLGQEGDDTVIGGDGTDLMSGGDGDDTLRGDGETDIIFGDAGDDTIHGGAGNDAIIGGEGADTQYGDEGDDLFVDVGAGDHVDGGAGYDTMVLSGPAIIDLDDGDPTSGTAYFLDFGSDVPVSQATFTSIEEMTYVIPEPEPEPVAEDGGDHSAIAGVTIGEATPPSSPGVVDGTGGDDIIDLSYTDDPEGDMVDNLDATDPDGKPTNDDIILGNDGDDTILAGLGDDDVRGGDGADQIFGETGDDVLRGGDGDDGLSGQEGDDKLHGGDGNDELHGGVGNDVLAGGEGDDHLVGNDGNDLLVGGDAAEPDKPNTEPGNDILEGGAGSDILFGDAGDDTLDLGDDTDIDVAFGGADRDTFTNASWANTPNSAGITGDIVIGGESGDDFDTLDLSGHDGPLKVNWTNDDPTTESGTVDFYDAPGGNIIGTVKFREIENVIPCFTPGTRVATPTGEMLVEELCVGDKVLTRDNGVQEIRWYGQKALDYGRLASVPHLQPIWIPAGSLGGGLPERDMMVSPNHRMLVANDRTSLYFAEHEVLVAAKHLVGRHGIKRLPQLSTTYIHFMFDRHEVVLADGAWTESFQPGDYTLSGIDGEQRGEILEIFPELGTVQGRADYVAARRTLKRHEALLLQH